MSAHKVEYWSKNYYFWSKYYDKIMTNIIARGSFKKIINNRPCYSWSMNSFPD